MNGRIKYIDTLKGYAIVMIVWWHVKHPDFVNIFFNVPLFFFISGMFFKQYPFKVFVKKRLSSLVIPLIVFYLISYIWRAIFYACCWHRFTVFDYIGHLTEFFSIEKGCHYLYVDVPLWFLMCLISVEFIYYFLSKYLNKALILILVVMCFIFHKYLSFPAPFMLSQASFEWTYFAIGNIFGMYMIKALKSNKETLVLGVVAAIMCLFHAEIKTYGAIIIAFIIASRIGNFKILNPLHFCGVNSLIIFGLHSPFNITFGHIMETVYNDQAPVWTGAMEAFVSIICLCLLCVQINRLLKFLSAKLLYRIKTNPS